MGILPGPSRTFVAWTRQDTTSSHGSREPVLDTLGGVSVSGVVRPVPLRRVRGAGRTRVLTGKKSLLL